MSKKTKNKRYRFFADKGIQGGLCIRIAIYWLACQVAVIGTIFALVALGGGEGPVSLTRYFVPALVISSLILPVALLDTITFSNRFAGPLLNIDRHVRQMAEGDGSSSRIVLRGRDFCQPMAENLNQIKNRIEMLTEQHSAPRQPACSKPASDVEPVAIASHLNSVADGPSVHG